MDCFPPDFISQPFTYLLNQLDNFTDYTYVDSDKEEDTMLSTRQQIERAVQRYEQPDQGVEEMQQDVERSNLEMRVIELMMAGEYQAVIDLIEGIEGEVDNKIIDHWAWAYVMLGNTLSDLSNDLEGEEAEGLFEQAFEKYGEALAIKPDKHEALYNWGSALAALARMKEGEEAEGLLNEAERLLLNAEEIQKGSGSYNLACVKSLLGQFEEARKWLETSYEVGRLPKLEHLATDLDMDPLRAFDWYKEFIEKVQKERGW